MLSNDDKNETFSYRNQYAHMIANGIFIGLIILDRFLFSKLAIAVYVFPGIKTNFLIGLWGELVLNNEYCFQLSLNKTL